MDEMDMVRDLRADAPEPDRRRLAPGRQRLVDTAGRGARTRRLRADWRLAAVGAAAAITATVLVGTLAVGGDPEASSPAHRADLPAHGAAEAPGDVRDVLLEAADRAAARTAPTPHPGQWIYTKLALVEPGSDEQPGVQREEAWREYTGQLNGEDETGAASPRETYLFLASLPDDPAAVRKKARAFYPAAGGETTVQHDYRALSLLAGAYPAPPRGLAAVYRALSTVPGVQVSLVADATGRDVFAIRLSGDRGAPYQQILFDPRTYAYVGHRGPSDDVQVSIRRLEIALVDGEWERP